MLGHQGQRIGQCLLRVDGDGIHHHAGFEFLDLAHLVGLLLGTRLIPDMLPLSRQVQIACRFAEESTARLAGSEIPKAPDNAEKTLGELRGRIDAVLGYIKGFKPDQINGSEGRDITLSIAGNPLKLTGEQYLEHFAMANFYFHCTTTHAILRQCGVEIGKRDFIGGI